MKKEEFGIVNIVDTPDERQIKQVSLLVLDFESDEKKAEFIKWLNEEQ